MPATLAEIDRVLAERVAKAADTGGADWWIPGVLGAGILLVFIWQFSERKAESERLKLELLLNAVKEINGPQSLAELRRRLDQLTTNFAQAVSALDAKRVQAGGNKPQSPVPSTGTAGSLGSDSGQNT